MLPPGTRAARLSLGRVRHASACAAVVLALSAPLRAQDARDIEPPPRGTTVEAANPDSRPFRLLLGAYIAASSTDTAVSMYQIGSGAGRERGFGAWMQDSPVAFAVAKSGLSMLVTYQLEKMHRTRPKLAFTIGLISTGVECALVAHAARIKARPR